MGGGIVGWGVDEGVYFVGLEDCGVVWERVMGNGIVVGECVDV